MITIIVQARMNSTRLPGKVLSNIAGLPMLRRVVNRARKAITPDNLLVATTNESDNPIVQYCQNTNIAYYAGDEHDVLGRTCEAAIFTGTDIIVRITADCPLIDPEVIDSMVLAFLKSRQEPEQSYLADLNYLCNVDPPTYPDGLNVEVFTLAALKRARQEAMHPLEREHVTLYIRRNPHKFRIANWRREPDLSLWRWTVDYPADMAFMRQVYSAMDTSDFDTADVLALLKERPDIARINAYLPAYPWVQPLKGHSLHQTMQLAPTID